jgi:hypothetical protein
MIVESELPQLRAALAKYEDTKNTKICYLMVNKRVKTKFVLESNNRAVNPSSGCLVDHTITGKDSWEFYIVSVEGKQNQGVPTPTHYSVILNEIEGL